MENFFSILDQMKQEHDRDRGINSSVLIIDAMNMFLRNFQGSPAMTQYGDHIGGVLGFIRSLIHNIKLFNPSRCIICMEGDGGSEWRRKLLPEYKKGRVNKAHFNRMDGFAQDESENLQRQIKRLGEYLNDLPVTVLFINGYEADDIISWVVCDYLEGFDFYETMIVSSDKDFLQLTTDKVKVYRPIEKRVYDAEEVSKEFGIKSENYLTLRTVTGDDGDNIKGINGLGHKTLLKYFPEIIDEVVSHERLVEIAKQRTQEGSTYKAYEKVLLSTKRLHRNYQLMQLHKSNVDVSGMTQLRKTLDRGVYKTDTLEFARKTSEDQISHVISPTELNKVMTKLDRYATREL